MSRMRGPGLALMLLLGACAGQTELREPANLGVQKLELGSYADSGRYAAGLAMVAAEAKAHLIRRAAEGGRLAIVLDVDETALSNLPVIRVNDFATLSTPICDFPRDPCGIVAWIQQGRAEAIGPTLDLAREAVARGVAVFFVTGRAEFMRAATERNLRAVGYAWTELVLKPDDLHAAKVAEFKAPARARIAAQGYTIILNMGDQQSDLDGGHAERRFKLPNPFYFLP